MEKSFIKMFVLIFTIILTAACFGCSAKSRADDRNVSGSESLRDSSEISQSSSETVIAYRQAELQGAEELSVPEDGKLNVEIESEAAPDRTSAEEKPVFLAVTLKEETSVSLQYTYDTFGKESAVLCCELKTREKDKNAFEPVYAMSLTQSSWENYGEIWFSNGATLKKGENLFYMNGGKRSLPYRMKLKLTFFEPENIEKVILYPPHA